ncbi:penicillin-binding protein 1C [Gangjinia marincola]|uniref:peptidoglycan glycosyltransferase n=1 Tax=Gangjinia marincola TaxID=578463 RepID=A0ABP3XWG6_9FLAO
MSFSSSHIKPFFSKHRIKFLIAFVLLLGYYFSLPKNLFSSPTSTIIESTEGHLIGAKIAADGQWRFPPTNSVPERFEICITYFEDECFRYHPGFNPISIVKALYQNSLNGEVKRGGSTLTQQVIRLSRKGKSRTYTEKIIELILATRAELRYSKKELLALYASNAPFGGNVVGLEAAAWRYFGRSAQELSWAETASLAVLPNAPSLIYPGKRQERLRLKRDRLLKKLWQHEMIDSLTYALSMQEMLPQKPYPLPQYASHALERLHQNHPGEKVQTTLNAYFQQQTNRIVKQHWQRLQQNQIHNAAVLVMDVHTREILVYVGNTPTSKEHQKDVDIISKPRSTGSILKPILYAAMLDAGELLPGTLVADVPTSIAGYTPKNFDNSFDGAVTAKRALSRSLNIPAVRMLQSFGLDRFHYTLKQLDLKDVTYGKDHYGLSLILGGAESNLWDLCKTYAAFSGTINHFNTSSSQYFSNEFREPRLVKQSDTQEKIFGVSQKEKVFFDAGSLYLTYESLKEVNRPQGEENWEFFDSSKQIAWKTGTSYGFRDAWAIGSTKDFVVGVWVGNADGEGRPGLIGLEAAAPILFDVFDLLPASDWFDAPFDALSEVEVCAKSGYRASTICPNKVKQDIPVSGLKTSPCPYHSLVHLDATGEYQVDSSCEDTANMVHTPWFTLPPLIAFYYEKSHPDYRALPPFKVTCKQSPENQLRFITPKANTKLALPKDFDESKTEFVAKITHPSSTERVFWYLNERYVTTTSSIHEMSFKPSLGKHSITVVDETGSSETVAFEIVE